MPPQLPRNSLSSFSRCSIPSFSSRPFTASTRLSFIGPENPKFIEIPSPRQPHRARRNIIKGTLPTPRNIFHPRAPDRMDPNYIPATMPELQNPRPPQDERQAWKRRLAANRRENLREGLLELHKRKVRQDNTMKIASSAKRRDREKRLHAPQREDDRLTSATVRSALQDLYIGLPDPDRAARVAAQAERTREKEVIKQELRREAIHKLYMHAREFITTEQQLDAEIEKIFVANPFGKGMEGKTSIWEAHGAPPTVQDLLAVVNKTQKKAMDFHRGPAHITSQRMKKIAEELTGGEMD